MRLRALRFLAILALAHHVAAHELELHNTIKVKKHCQTHILPVAGDSTTVEFFLVYEGIQELTFWSSSDGSNGGDGITGGDVEICETVPLDDLDLDAGTGRVILSYHFKFYVRVGGSLYTVTDEVTPPEEQQFPYPFWINKENVANTPPTDESESKSFRRRLQGQVASVGSSPFSSMTAEAFATFVDKMAAPAAAGVGLGGTRYTSEELSLPLKDRVALAEKYANAFVFDLQNNAVSIFESGRCDLVACMCALVADDMACMWDIYVMLLGGESRTYPELLASEYMALGAFSTYIEASVAAMEQPCSLHPVLFPLAKLGCSDYGTSKRRRAMQDQSPPFSIRWQSTTQFARTIRPNPFDEPIVYTVRAPVDACCRG